MPLRTLPVLQPADDAGGTPFFLCESPQQRVGLSMFDAIRLPAVDREVRREDEESPKAERAEVRKLGGASFGSRSALLVGCPGTKRLAGTVRQGSGRKGETRPLFVRKSTMRRGNSPRFTRCFRRIGACSGWGDVG